MLTGIDTFGAKILELIGNHVSDKCDGNENNNTKMFADFKTMLQ